MTSTIKAIETVYNDYRFRSRLEARWAVFFDAAGILYQYEPEGFQLVCGWYLPDFFIPQWDCFIEVKGQSPSDKEKTKAGELCAATGKNVYIVGNTEFDGYVQTIGFEPYTTDGLESTPGCFAPTYSTFIHECLTHGFVIGFTGVNKCTGDLCQFSCRGPILNKAFAAAKQARFEHGETPGSKQKWEYQKDISSFIPDVICKVDTCDMRPVTDVRGELVYCAYHMPEELKTETRKFLDTID
jgi:hypothetical protein